MHLGFNTSSNVWVSVSIPATGGWQNWTTVSVPVGLGAGNQLMTVLSDSGGFNLDSIAVSSGTSSPSQPPPPSAPSGSGSEIVVVQWNVQVNDSGSGHARTVIDNALSPSPRPRVVVIEEGHQSQFDTYISELNARTGETWHGVFFTHCPPGAFT